MTDLQEAADLNNTVTINSHRFEESPFIYWWAVQPIKPVATGPTAVLI